MADFWWQIPGPGKFIQNIANELQDGKNVILCLPAYHPSGINRAVKLLFEHDSSFLWQTINLEDYKTMPPIDMLFEKYITGLAPEEIRNIKNLVQHEAFKGRIIWLDGMTPELWKKWKIFIQTYEHACRTTSFLERTLFIIPLEGKIAIEPPDKEVCLSVIHWKNQVSKLNMLLYVSSIYRKEQEDSLSEKMAISVITNLAKWDPELSKRLASEKLSNILNPKPLLIEFAKERLWDNFTVEDNQDLWCEGITDSFEGDNQVHSAFMALQGDERSITYQIWSAQVGLMLPLIEEKRHIILRILSGTLMTPYTTGFGEVIEDARDLEIGHIEDQISKNTRISKKGKQYLFKLRKIRNCLSHLEPIHYDHLYNNDLNLDLKTTELKKLFWG